MCASWDTDAAFRDDPDLAALYRWRDQNAWRVRGPQHEANDKWIKRLEQQQRDEAS